jgi:lipopolysaccharide transport system permease protein
MEQEKWDLVIRPRKSLFDIDLGALWRYRDLVAMFVRRDFVAKYKQTILGPLWYIIQPLLTTLMFTVIFSGMAKISTDGLPPLLFYMAGTIAWNYFATCLTSTSTTFVSNANIFGKVYFPRLTVPVATVISSLVQFGIQALLLIGFMIYYSFHGISYALNWNLLLIPFLIILMAMMGLGFGILISSMTTKYRDLTYLVSFGVQLWMYATPIIYPLSTVPAKYQALVLINPISPIVEIFRYATLGVGTFHIPQLIYSIVWSIGILLIGIVVFNKVEQSFIDTV